MVRLLDVRPCYITVKVLKRLALLRPTRIWSIPIFMVMVNISGAETNPIYRKQ